MACLTWGLASIMLLGEAGWTALILTAVIVAGIVTAILSVMIALLC